MNPLTRMQDDVYALLTTDPNLSDVTIHQEDKGTIADKIRKALEATAPDSGKKPGLSIVVNMPTLTVKEPDSVELGMIVEGTVTILEKPMTNREAAGTGIEAAAAAEIVMKRLQYRGVGMGSLLCQGAEPLRDEGTTIGYTVNFTLFRGLGYEDRAGNVRISFSGGNCTLTGAGASGEVVYYTTDGTAPVPDGETTEEYSTPFAVTSGDTVRAVAVATGKELGDFAEEVAP